MFTYYIHTVYIPVDILLNVAGNVKVDDMLHVRNVQTPGSHRRGYQDGSAARFETVQRSFPIGLATITMDTSDRITLYEEEEIITLPIRNSLVCFY